MKSILYFTFLDLEAPGKEGLIKKIHSQSKAMEAYGEVEVCYPHNGELLFKKGDEVVFRYKLGFSLDKFAHRDAIIGFLKRSDYTQKFDYVYVRNFMMIDFFILSIYKAFAKRSKVILEIPTYPFDNEIKTFQKKFLRERHYIIFIMVALFNWMHKFGIKIVPKYLERIVTFNPIDEIWGVPTTVIQNGADVPVITKEKFSYAQEGKVVFVGVGSFVPWHGFDRFIKGMGEYVKQKASLDIHFNIIGDGPDVPEYKKTVEDLGLTEYVTFKGILTGEKLAKEYLNADFAIGSLGLHRIHLDKASPIKTKEYFSYGLPFVYSYTEDDFLEQSPFTMRVPMEEAPVDVQKVIDFFHQVQKEEGYRNRMNQLAQKNLTWDMQVKKIFQAIGEEEND